MKNNKIKRDIILYIVIIVFVFGFLQINLGDPTSSTLYEIINESATFLFFYPNLEFGITGYTTAGPGQPTELKVQVCTAAINEVENKKLKIEAVRPWNNYTIVTLEGSDEIRLILMS